MCKPYDILRCGSLVHVSCMFKKLLFLKGIGRFYVEIPSGRLWTSYLSLGKSLLLCGCCILDLKLSTTRSGETQETRALPTPGA